MPMAAPSDPVRTDYQPYPKSELAFPLSTVHVEAVSAVYHRCTVNWRIKERTVPDDMFFYFVSGRARFRAGSREVSAGPGDCLHLPRSLSQSAMADPYNPPAVIVLHYHARTFGSIPLASLAGFPLRMHVGDTVFVEGFLNEACREFLHKPAGWREGLNAKVWELLLYLIRHHGSEFTTRASTEEWRHLGRLQPALQHMEKTLAEPPAMAVIARSCGYSEAQFRRIFRRTVGQSPIAYLRKRRMEEACLLLRETDLKVEDIASRVGYTEPAFFWSTFKILMGRTPANYRRLALQSRI